MQQFRTASCAAADENNLDKIDGVVPMRNDLFGLVGQTVCAVVYDSDVSVDVAQGFASLKGATLGGTAFTVRSVNPNPAGGSYLPLLTVDLIASANVGATCNTATATAGGSAFLTR